MATAGLYSIEGYRGCPSIMHFTTNYTKWLHSDLLTHIQFRIVIRFIPCTALWSSSSLVLHIRHAQTRSLFTSSSDGVQSMYSRKIYSALLLFGWVFKRNSRNNFATQSAYLFSSSLEINIKLFRILALVPNLSITNICWTCFHNSGLSRIRSSSST